MNNIKKKNIKKIVMIASCFTIVCLYVFLYAYTNLTFPQAEKEYYMIGDKVTIQGAEFSINNGVILDFNFIEQNEELRSQVEMYVSSDIENVKLFIVECEFINKTDDILTIDLTSIHLESNEFSLAVFFPLFQYFNESSMYVELKSGETKKLILPIPVNKISFSEKKWNKIDERDFYITDSLYPTKKLIKIDFVKQENP